MIELRDAKPGDAGLLQLRPEDAQEVSAGWVDRTEAEIAAGRVRAAWDGDELVALFGLTTGPDFMAPWLLASPSISRYRRETCTEARKLVRLLQREGYPTVVGNYVGKQAAGNRRFIQALGFVILPCPTGDHDFFYLPKHV